MNNNTKNNSIGCTVNTCKYHCSDCNCCSRANISVGAENESAHSSDCTCCRSFEEKIY